MAQYVPETVMPVLLELCEAYDKYKEDPGFQGRGQPLFYAICRTADDALLCRKLTNTMARQRFI